MLKDADQVRAAAAGELTEIVRDVHPVPAQVRDGKPMTIRSWYGREVLGEISCPLGDVGTHLWVREDAWLLQDPGVDESWTFAPVGPDAVAYCADMRNPPPTPVAGQRWALCSAGKLPRERARTVLRIDRIEVREATVSPYVWVVHVSKVAG